MVRAGLRAGHARHARRPARQRRRRPRRATGAAPSASTIPTAVPSSGAGDVVDDVGDVAGPVDAGQLQLGRARCPRSTPRAAARRRHQQAGRAPAGARAPRAGHRRAGTAAVLSSRCPLSKIQNPSGAGPPMSVEQVVSRPSAGTMPGAPFAGISVTQAITSRDQTQPGEREGRHRPQRAAQGEAEQEAQQPRDGARRAASRPHHRPGTRGRGYRSPRAAAPRPAPPGPASVTMGSTPRPACRRDDREKGVRPWASRSRP